jgi:hypothetical protein
MSTFKSVGSMNVGFMDVDIFDGRDFGCRQKNIHTFINTYIKFQCYRKEGLE